MCEECCEWECAEECVKKEECLLECVKLVECVKSAVSGCESQSV